MDEHILSTQRLTLRPIREEDAEMIWPYVSDPRISKDMSWDAHTHIDQTRAFIAGALKSKSDGRAITWCIFQNGEFRGVFSLISILRTHRSLTYNRAELAYWIGPEFEGQGIMTEAGNRILEYAYDDLGLHKLTVGHHTVNSSSEKLILRLGFEFLFLEREVFMKNGEWVDCKFYELNEKDFRKKRNQ